MFSAPRLVLASTSPYRRALLQRLGIAFEVAAPEVDETPVGDERPAALACRLALAKAMAVGQRHPAAVIVGSDQTATLDGVSLIGKPGTHARAAAQLRAASGRELWFHTGLCLLQPGRTPIVERVDTRVRFRTLEDDEIERYLIAERPYDCTGSAKAEGLGITLIEAQIGEDPTALVGLPLIRLSALLRAAGWALP